MDNTNAHCLLETLINYFEAGNKESDKAAKAIIEYDFDNLDKWRKEIKRLRESGEWTGLRSPEADIIAGALRYIQEGLNTTK